MPVPASDANIYNSHAVRMNDPFSDGDITSHRPSQPQWKDDSDSEEDLYSHPPTANFEDGDISLARTTLPSRSHTRYLEQDNPVALSAREEPSLDLGESFVPYPHDENGDLSVVPSNDEPHLRNSIVTVAAVEDEEDISEQVTAEGEAAPTPAEDKADVLIGRISINVDAEVPQDQALPTVPIERTYSPELADKSAPSSPPATYPTPAKAEAVSEWSHQQLAPHPEADDDKHDDEGEWQDMPAFAAYDIYDDDGKLIAKENEEEAGAPPGYSTLGGAAKGYTKVQLDEDAQSANSMDEDTAYLFNQERGAAADEFDEDLRDPLAQLQATKDLLTDNQKIAYIGVVRLAMADIIKDVESMERTRGAKKEVDLARDTIKLWAQKMMVLLYAHMELNSAEQLMIEQLAQHGVTPGDLTPSLMQNSRVKNPASDDGSRKSISLGASGLATPARSSISRPVSRNGSSVSPPPYEELDGADMPRVRTPSQLPTTEKLDIDIRWTVLCDLFLTLVSGSSYDARSRALLERVGSFLSVPWLDICRFEKRVTDALEMQEEANKEDWDEADNMEKRRKQALKRRMLFMGLATVGGGIVIGLSAGLLAPVIGAGLAAGFTTIGVTGTSTFLAGAGGAAVIGTGAAAAGGAIGNNAANRRTGAVKTFEYRPLHNNKRVNLIVTVAGWMTGKIDDVRLPYSTVDPIMGDIYSIHWEPEMLRSMGDTINILATEALTQGLQQILGSTILISLMAAIQLPVVLTKLAYLIDNPWSNSLARADMAGLILADSLIERSLGSRPITLVGFSLGSRLIFSCLRELSKRGAVGLIQNVYLFGSPVLARKDDYLKVKTVVSGRFVNGYATNDWILGYLFRATGGGLARVAGLAKVEVPGIENIDVTKFVPGHMAYRASMPRLLREVGWAVTSDEFEEIEDPDPDNHEKRQRELINEIEEARKNLQDKPSKKFFGLFKSRKGMKKKEWETYEESSRAGSARADSADGASENNGSVVFDVDAITREVAGLAAQGLEVKELKSTLPPMKIDLRRPAIPTNGHAAEASDSRRRTSASGTSTPAGTAPKSQPSHTPDHYDYDEYEDYHTPGKEEVTMSFGSPSINRHSAPQTFDPPLSNSNSRVGSNSYDDYRGSSAHPSVSLDMGPERRFGSSLYDNPIERSPSTPPTLGSATRVPSHGKDKERETSMSRAGTPLRSVTPVNSTIPPPKNHDPPPGKNIWADDDEEDFGQEKEMEMTFE